MKAIDQILAYNHSGGAKNLKHQINVVAIRGVNDSQDLLFVEMTPRKDLEVRFIPYMPFSGNKWAKQKILRYQEILAAIREIYPGIEKVQGHPNDTRKIFRIPSFKAKLGSLPA